LLLELPQQLLKLVMAMVVMVMEDHMEVMVMEDTEAMDMERERLKPMLML